LNSSKFFFKNTGYIGYCYSNTVPILCFPISRNYALLLCKDREDNDNSSIIIVHDNNSLVQWFNNRYYILIRYLGFTDI